MTQLANPYPFLDYLTRQMVKSWIALEKPRPIPWTPLSRPLQECTVALISTGAVALNTDEPFDQEGERQNPWWGDPSYRILPATATEKDVTVYHLHINAQFAAQDLNCLMPIQRLNELAESGEIGRVAPHHYSIMGYILRPRTLLETTTPAIIRHLHEDAVDMVVLIPA